jgi:DNA modification methylase
MAKPVITDKYAIYNGDSCDILKSVPDNSIHLSCYSPPFAGHGSAGGLYHYSSSPRDLSNATNYEQFMEHYAFIVSEMARITMPGRMSCVHCMDVPNSNTGDDDFTDFPGDIIRLHHSHGFRYKGRHCIWKEPLGVRNRTMAKHLTHKTIIEDAVYSSPAGADFLLLFQKKGKNPVQVSNPSGLMDYAGERKVPYELHGYRGYEGNQRENRFSQWIWRQYASSFWDDIRIDNVLPYREAREGEDEKHVHPLQLDVIERCVQLYSNANESVLTPFMGVGSEVYGAVIRGRKGIGIELKESYFNQSIKNLELASQHVEKYETMNMFEEVR